jgi:hypothetical protein
LDAQDRERLTNLIVDKNLTRENVRAIISKLNYSINDEEPLLSYYSDKIKHEHIIERTLMKCIASFKVCMTRIDQILDDVDQNDWLMREVLMQYRQSVHKEIDSLLRVKKKMMRIARYPNCKLKVQ